MHRHEILGKWVRRFLLEHIVGERNLSANTQRSYRDTLAMLLPFLSAQTGRPLDRLEVIDLSAPCLRLFLAHLEQQRRVSVTTRNQRLAAIRSLARFVAERSPQHVAWYSDIKTVPFKKTIRNLICYLEKSEVEALLAIPDRTTIAGRRNHALLLFLYNSGARASEAAGLCIADLDLTPTATPSVRILGKGMKERRCPLWKKTATELAQLVEGRSPRERVFLNRCGQPLTRFGVYNLLKVLVERAGKRTPSLLTKGVSPHTLRHSTATHLLRAGVDLNTIRSWLGHVSLDTTQVYAEMDLEMKARALEKCDTMEFKKPAVGSSEPLMDFLRAI
jgi:integrase/recombinase XerD